jgi:hypothetical protein
MQLIAGMNLLSPGTLITLSALVDGGVGPQDWNNRETYPVSLGWGVTLSAPGVYFADGTSSEIFDIAVQPGEDAGNIVTIQGSADGGFVVVGTDSSGNIAADPTAITIEANAILNVNYLDVYEQTSNTGISLSDMSSTLYLDQHCSGGPLNLGPLAGGNLPNGVAPSVNMGLGIDCFGTITDANSCAGNSLIGQGQLVSLAVENEGWVNLAKAPLFGWPTAGGYTGADAGCMGNPKMDGTAVEAFGGATVSLTNATITCMDTEGVYTDNPKGDPNTPVVSLTNITIRNCGYAGLSVSAGSVTVNSGTIDHNYRGIDMENDVSLDAVSVTLNDGSSSNNTTISCNSNLESGGADPGIDVFNNSSGTVTADYVNWDHWYDPNMDTTVADSTDIFSCSGFLSPNSCLCQVFDSTGVGACADSAGSDGMDLVIGEFSGSQTSTNGAQAVGACN